MGRPAGAFRRDPEPHGPHRENAIRLSEQRRDARALKQGGDVELETACCARVGWRPRPAARRPRAPGATSYAPRDRRADEVLEGAPRSRRTRRSPGSPQEARSRPEAGPGRRGSAPWRRSVRPARNTAQGANLAESGAGVQRGAPGRAPRARACRQAAHGVSPGRTRRCSASGNNLEAQLLDGCEACNGVTPHTLRGKAKAPDRCGACVAFYMRLLNFRLSLIPKMNGLDVRSARSNISSAMLITKATTL